MKFTRKTAKFLNDLALLAYIISSAIDILITRSISSEEGFSNWYVHQIFFVIVLVAIVLEVFLPLSDEEIQKKYVEAGKSVGDALSYIYMGICGNFEEMLEKWMHWEKEYAVRGYKILPVDDFVEYARGGTLKGLGIKRQVDEEPIFHAEIVKKEFPTYGAQVTIDSVSKEGAVSGTYVLPSTKSKS